MGLSEYLFGKISEDNACKYLSNLKFKILERNFHSKFGEIDVIAADTNGVLHFIEVKATSGNYETEYRLNASKYKKILKAIDYYLLKNGQNSDFQIDLLTINKDKFELIRNIS
ncbi:MAG: YraN family protein, partial [Campylobacter sp.]|nr:YraN family protein [Campylobacter sp.]